MLTAVQAARELACRCPWCGLAMEPDTTKDPLLELCCDLCATFTLEQRKVRNPEMAKLYDAALLYDALRFCGWPAYVIDRGDSHVR